MDKISTDLEEESSNPRTVGQRLYAYTPRMSRSCRGFPSRRKIVTGNLAVDFEWK